jgi:hypothetical protein
MKIVQQRDAAIGPGEAKKSPLADLDVMPYLEVCK